MTIMMATIMRQVYPISKSKSNICELILQFKVRVKFMIFDCNNKAQFYQMNQVVIKVIGNYSYQTSRCLGEGVYGKVYQGMQRQTKQKVAIKKIDLNTFTNDKYLQNAIFSQIYLLKRFSHPNIVKFKDVLSSKNSLYIITEFCKNGDLKQLIKRKRFKQQQAFQILRQLLSGFSELVREKIIHRDLKPANILINQGIYKIADFGFAKYVDNFGSQLLKSCVGSPIYMAPQILERTQYTTKCDIWSLGIIFYQMIHGYPPWKARDQNELLKAVKNVSISQVLKKSNLSAKCVEFLKKTLTFSQEQRIGWNELFENFGNSVKTEKPIQQTQSKLGIGIKQKQRVTSTHISTVSNNFSATSTLSPDSQWSKDSPVSYLATGSTPTINVQNHNHSLSPYSGSTTNIHMTPERTKNNYISSNTSNQLGVGQRSDHIDSHYGSNLKRNSQVETAAQWRQYLAYFHFYCVEMKINYSFIQGVMPRPELFAKFLYSLALLVKNRSTYSLSTIIMQSKINKTAEQLYKKMQVQHQSYQLIAVDVLALLERNGCYKMIRNDLGSLLGSSQIISQDRIDKLQNFMISAATQNAQILSEQVKKRVKFITNRDYSLVLGLDHVLDVLRLALGKNKTLKQIQEDQHNEDEDIKDYVARVFGKVDRLGSNF